MLIETLGHTRMLQWHWVGIVHWFVFAASSSSAPRCCRATPALQPEFALPIIGHWFPYEWATEPSAWLGLIGIVALIAIRQRNHPRRLGRKSRFFGSPFWQAYFVEAMVMLEGAAILSSAAPSTSSSRTPRRRARGRVHFPISSWIGEPLADSSRASRTSSSSSHVQDRPRDGLAHRHRPQPHDGRRLAPLHGVAQHLVQARQRRQHGAGRAAADQRRRQAARPREHGRPRGGGLREARRRQGRGLHLEGHPRLHDVHRVRTLPEPVPRLEHREAAVAQAADDGAARARLRQGAAARRCREEEQAEAQPTRPERRARASR